MGQVMPRITPRPNSSFSLFKNYDHCSGHVDLNKLLDQVRKILLQPSLKKETFPEKCLCPFIHFIGV